MKRQSTLFKLADYLDGDERFHFSKSYLSYEIDLAYHHHDYYEVFWVVSGNCTHLLNGRELALSKGELIFLKPEDSHTFGFDSPQHHIVLYNVALLKKDVNHFQSRYLNLEKDCFWQSSKTPNMRKLSTTQLDTLCYGVQKFLDQPRGVLQLDSILLSIIHSLPSTEEKLILPHWLEKAIYQFSRLQELRGGSEQFLTYCNRSHDHVNRTVQKFYKKTLTSFLNDIRLRNAKHQLMVTNKGIKVIAFSVGFADVSYFHKIFKLNYGTTPTAFRKKNVQMF